MTVYHPNDNKPISEQDVSTVAAALNWEMKGRQNSGMDGKDVALGTISALRVFVLYNVGVEGVADELKSLAEELTK